MPDQQRKLSYRVILELVTLIIVTGLVAIPQARAANPAELCTRAALMAAERHNVPIQVLRAIALVETGRKTKGQMRAWPWTLHVAGQGHWFETSNALLVHAQASLQAGIRNMDLGCFQINYHWHAHHFASLEEMIDPIRNADHAARLLVGHKARLGSWEEAAGAYHSATPHIAERYLARFFRMQQFVDPDTPSRLTDDTRENRFALLLPSGTGRLGSLVAFDGRPAGPRLIDMEAIQP